MAGEVNAYNITCNLTNITSSNILLTISNTDTWTTTLTADTGYNLPDSITVSGASHSYNPTTGVLELSNPTSNVTITATAIAIKQNLSMRIVVKNGTLTSASQTLTAASGYSLPKYMQTAGADLEYDSTTGATTLSNISSNGAIAIAPIELKTGSRSNIRYTTNLKVYTNNFAEPSNSFPVGDLPVVGYGTEMNILAKNIDEDESEITYYNATNVYKEDEICEGLPEGYTQLEYIQTDGSSYIDTGITPVLANGTKITGAFALTNTANVLYQSLGSNNNLNIYNGGGTGSDSCFNICGETTSIPLDLNKHEYELELKSDGRYAKFDKNNYIGTLSGTLGTSHFLLGAMSIDGEILVGGRYKIYETRIYDGGILVRDFIPAKNSSNIPGMYDLCTGTFYQKLGSGNFTAGPDY